MSDHTTVEQTQSESGYLVACSCGRTFEEETRAGALARWEGHVHVQRARRIIERLGE